MDQRRIRSGGGGSLFLVCVVCGASLLVTSFPFAVSRADEDPDTEIARRHFDAGTEAYGGGHYAEALAEFEAARRVRPSPAFDYNIGRCLDRLERFGEAIDAYQRYLAGRPDADDGPSVRERIGVLQGRVAEEEAARAKKASEAPPVTPPPPPDEAAVRAAEEARAKAARDDDARLKRMAAELVDAEQRKKLAEEEALRRRVAEAGRKGHALRIAGAIVMVAGALAIIATALPFGTFLKADNKISQFNDSLSNGSSGDPWSTSLDQSVRDRDTSRTAMLALPVAGIGTLILGGILHGIGTRQRANAEAEARAPASVRLLPLVSPQLAGLAAGGVF